MKKKGLAALILASVLVCSNGLMVQAEETKVEDYQGLSEQERVTIIGKACQEDYQESGILASVSAAQCILESGYMSTDLAVNANNCFGMKASLSGNTWADSIWDGVSTYTKNTHEEYNGADVVITADFRSYASLEQSIADHSAYLLGAMNDQGYRYAGLQGEKDYRVAINIIKNGGYATDSDYVDKICNIIERFNLTQYDVIEEKKEETVEPAMLKPITYQDKYYRVRKTWSDEKSQIGAYFSLNYAKRACAKGYTVFDPQGKIVYIEK